MANNIVQVNVSQTQAPAPSTLQRTGAIISQGGTTKAPQSLTLATSLADVVAILEAAIPITSMTETGTTVTLTVSGGHGFDVADVIPISITGALPVGYNGNWNATITSSTAMTFTAPSGLTSPATTPGTLVVQDRAELLAQATTFYAQGSGLSVYILELGAGPVNDGVTALTTFLTANSDPQIIYSYLVPKEWDANANFLTLMGSYENTTAKTYFFITSTAATYTSYTALMKCAFVMIPAPAAPATEFACAAPFWVTLNYNPGSTNKVPPLAFSYLFGVTPYPRTGNTALLTQFRTANVNYVDTGAEGGISNTILKWGYLKDGKVFNYWYAVDFAQINLALSLANTVINGSNNPINPLYYNQPGINSLQDVATQQLGNMVSYGLLTGQVTQTQLSADVFAQNFNDGLYRGQLVINAEPLLIYTAENPNDYAIGKYAGFAAVITPLRGFESIIFDLNATTFI